MPADEGPLGADVDPAKRIDADETVDQGIDAAFGTVGNASAPAEMAGLAEFSRSVVELGLIGAEELESLAADRSEGVLGLSRALVAAGKLTPYQAAAVFQKKSRGLLVGNYVILDKIGQGGMGMVFKCRHRRLGRVGALKILPPSFARDHQAVMRFRREVEAAGRLKHPNVVAAVDADEDRGVHFLVMDFVAGRDLDRVVRDRGPMPVAQAIDCLMQAARGLEAAHAEGIVHRDIKPGNLMLDSTGTVRVLDLGLARLVDAANPFGKAAGARLTESGMYMGTVDFMAPEQAEDSHRVDHRADIYALGCTLFYLLTGRSPFHGPTILKRLMAHQQEPIPSLRAARPEVPANLEAVYQKMMAKSPADRLSSMTELISLLDSCRAGAQAKTTTGDARKSRPELMVFDEVTPKRTAHQKTVRDASIFVRPTEREGLATDHDLNLEDLVVDVRSDPQPIKRSGRSAQVRRVPRNAGVVAALGSIAVLAAGFTWFVVYRANLGTTGKSTDVSSVETDQSGQGRMTQIAEASDGKAASVTPVKDESPALAKSAAPGPSAVLATDLGPYVESARFVGHAHPWVEWVRVSPDGKQLLTSGYDRTARLWDIASGRELRRLTHPTALRPVAFHPDGRRAVTGCNDGVVRLWDLESGKVIRELSRHPGPLQAVAVSSDGLHALSGGENSILRLLEIETGKQVIQYDGVAAPIISAAISPDGRRIMAGCSNGTIHFGETNSQARLQSITAHTATVWDVCISQDSRHAGSAGRDGTVIYWDLDSQRAWGQKNMTDFQVRCLAFEPDGRRLICGGQNSTHPGENGAIGIWDVTSDGPAAIVTQPFAHLGLAILPRGGFATSDDQGVARIWEHSTPITEARAQKQAGNGPGALIHYDKAVAARPGDARLLIERGRLLASLGQDVKADVDFEKAARLAPDNPQLFVDAGWWVASPYSGGLEPRPEFETSIAASPSNPPPPSGSDIRSWHELPVGVLRQVDLGQVIKSDNIAAYALNVVYSTVPRYAVLLVGSDDAARVWLNGIEVVESPEPGADSRCVIVSLKRGRNSILAKVANIRGTHFLNLRISLADGDFARAYAEDKKWDQAEAAYNKAVALAPDMIETRVHELIGQTLAERERWKEAKAVFETIAAFDPGNSSRQQDLLRCYLALKDREDFERVCAAEIARHGKSQDRNLANNVIWLAALMPGVVHNYAEVVDIGRKLNNTGKPTPGERNTFGALLYRAGQYQGSLSQLKRSIDAQKGKGNAFDWVFTAMARHKSKQPGDRDALARAKALANTTPTTWQYRVELSALLEEAERELKAPSPRE